MKTDEPNEQTSVELAEIDPQFQRYAKQIRFPELGVAGQQKLANARAVVVGVGALGSVVANTLARAGVGELVLVDRDFIERDNLQRQVLYEEADVGMPKAIVAGQALARVNSTIEIYPLIADVDYKNVLSILQDPRRADVIIDGTDNFETRFLINDASAKTGIAWIYGGCLGCDGQTMTILPGQTPCLRCLMINGPPPPGTTATCDSAGILAPVINVIASIQSLEAIKIMSGNLDKVSRSLQSFDLWNNRVHQMNVADLRGRVECPTCKSQSFQWLAGSKGSHSAILCGRNAVQVSFPDRPCIQLDQLSQRLQPLGRVETNKFLVRFYVDDFILTAFADGRAIINGTEDISVAKRLYAQYIGS